MDATEIPAARPMRRFLLVASLMLVAFNMRPAMSSLGPVLPEAMRDTGLDAGSAGLLTTVPVLCLGVFGLAAPSFGRRLGPDATMVAFMLLLGVGIAIRIFGTEPALVLGCALGGVGIGVVNVIAPGVVKREFPDQAAAMMGVYTMVLCIGAAAAAGATAPMAHAFGGDWAKALAVWAIPAVLSALAWASQLGGGKAAPAEAGPKGPGLWRSALAWQVTLFLGLAAALAYSIFAWLAPMLRDRGLSAVDAGFVVSEAVLLQAPAALAAPVIAGRRPDQRLATVVAVLFSVAGFAGCLFGPLSMVWAWAVVLAIGQGATFALALTLIVLRAPDAATAGRLSAMSQGVGYTIGAAGPLLMGLFRDWSGGWTVPGMLFFAIAAGTALSGWGAGAPRTVSPPPAPEPAAA